MKKIVLSLIFIGLTLPAYATPLTKIYLGQFQIGKCNVLAWDHNAPVLITANNDKDNNLTGLSLYIYYADGGGTNEEIVIGTYEMSNPEYRNKNQIKTIIFHGEIFADRILQTVTYVFGNGKVITKSQKQIQLTQFGLLYSETSNEKKAHCELHRLNKSNH